MEVTVKFSVALRGLKFAEDPNSSQCEILRDTLRFDSIASRNGVHSFYPGFRGLGQWKDYLQQKMNATGLVISSN